MRMRPAGLVVRPLHPFRLVLEIAPWPSWSAHRPTARRRCLRCRRDIRGSDSRAGSARRGRRCAAASGRRARAGRPGARCDDGRRRSRSRRPPSICSERMCATIAALEPPATMSSTNGRIASRPAVCGVKARVGRERRQPVEPPRAARQFRGRVAHRGDVAALEAVGDHDDRGAARIAGETRHGEKRLQARRRCACRRPNR